MNSKVVLITGASMGLGESIAVSLVRKGYKVYGTSRSIKSDGRTFKVLPMDVTDMDSIRQCVDEIVRQEGRIDVLINNAGLGLAGPVEELDIDDVEKVFSTNVFGVLKVCKAVLPVMRENKSGLIINISSIGSEMGLPFRGGYSASKAALERLTEALRLEIRPFGLQACLVQPGGVKTDINKNRVVSISADSAYKERFDRNYEVVNQSVSKGLDPVVFGEVIDRIICASKVKRVYRIGKLTEKLVIYVKRIFPVSVYEGILRNHFKI